MNKIVEISNEEVSALYSVASGLVEMSKTMKPYRSSLSNMLLLLSESLIMDLTVADGEQTEPKESLKLDQSKIADNKAEIEALMNTVKEDIKDEK